MCDIWASLGQLAICGLFAAFIVTRVLYFLETKAELKYEESDAPRICEDHVLARISLAIEQQTLILAKLTELIEQLHKTR